MFIAAITQMKPANILANFIYRFSYHKYLFSNRNEMQLAALNNISKIYVHINEKLKTIQIE